jgi:hypothetical protein
MRWLPPCAVRAPEPEDPLPEGAVARCGNGRLQHGGFAFSPDGRTFVSERTLADPLSSAVACRVLLGS